MPGGCKRTGLRLAIAHGDGDNEIGIIERRSISMRDGVAKLAAFVNRTRRFWGAVRSDSSGKRELPEKLEQARFVATLVGIDLGVVAFEIAIGKCGGRAMTGAGEVYNIQVVLSDEPVQMNPNQRLAGIGSPVTKKPILDVFPLQRFTQKRIRAQVDHACRQIIASSPVGMNLPQFFGRKGSQFSGNSHQIFSDKISFGPRSNILTLDAQG